MNAICIAGSKFVAVGSNSVLVSEDGFAWREHLPDSIRCKDIFGVAASESLTVAVGSSILYSPDLDKWTDASSSISGIYDLDLRSVFNDSSAFTIAGLKGLAVINPVIVCISKNRTISQGSCPAPFTSMAGTAGKYIGVASGVWVYNGSWSRCTTATQQPMRTVIWTGAGGQFIMAGAQGTVCISPDGEAWTEHATGVTVPLNALAWSGSLTLAAGDSGTIVTSPDGTAWSVESTGCSQRLLSAAWNGSRFVAVGEGGTILTSSPGASVVKQGPHRYWRSGPATCGSGAGDRAEIYTAAGRLIATRNINHGIAATKGLTPGTYLVRLRSSGDHRIRKLVVSASR